MIADSMVCLTELALMHFVTTERLMMVGTKPAGTEETSSWSVIWSAVGQTVFRSLVGEGAGLG